MIRSCLTGAGVKDKQMKPRYGVKICCGHTQSLICWLFFTFGRDRREAADRKRADRWDRESSPYQSPSTLACPCVWAESHWFNLVLGLHSTSFACQSAILHSVWLRIKIMIQILYLGKHDTSIECFPPLRSSILFQHSNSTPQQF